MVGEKSGLIEGGVVLRGDVGGDAAIADDLLALAQRLACDAQHARLAATRMATEDGVVERPPMPPAPRRRDQAAIAGEN